jgi:hypothetical protein
VSLAANTARKVNYLFRAATGTTAELISDPSLITGIGSCINHASSSNWEAGEPWWNARAIDYLQSRLPREGRAFEWGSGGSTVWLTRNGMSVTAIESEYEWAERVRKRCPAADVRFIPGTDTGTLRSEPQLRDRGVHYFDEYVSAIDGFAAETFDVIVIDGICRKECASFAAKKVKPGGIVVLDDTNWKYLRRAAGPFAGWETVTLSGFKQKSGPFVYSTTFFHAPA